MIDKFKDAFIDEATELLNQFEELLLNLESNPEDFEAISAVFRTMHTIKGSSAMFGFEVISTFTHEIENVYDDIREGKLEVSKGIIDLSLEARDIIRNLLEDDKANYSEEIEKFLNKFYLEVKLQNANDEEVLPEEDETKTEFNEELTKDENNLAELTYRIIFNPDKEIFSAGTNPLLIIDELSKMGDATILTNFNNIRELDKIDPEKCYFSWNIILTTNKSLNEIRDVFIFIENNSEIKIEEITNDENDNKLLGEILVERGIVEKNDLDLILDEQKKLGEVLVEKKIVNENDLGNALKEQDHLRKVKDKKKIEESIHSIRVKSEKLDKMVDLVGELVTVRARLKETATYLENNDLSLITEQVERLIAELRDNTMSMRMLPLNIAFAKFRRLVRDLSSSLNKEISLQTEGEDTELDKTVIEKLNDPLVHLIRNCIDHGIEKPELRVKNGKDKMGIIKLSAIHKGTKVEINIDDDGAGLDPEVLRLKAVEKKIIRKDDVLTDQECFDLIFKPGFSTASSVTSVSGRGVGMDVVKREIENLGGQVLINSKLGFGTRISLQLPLTLAIIEGLLVKINDSFFVLPLASVRKCVEYSRLKNKDNDFDVINIENKAIPFVDLRSVFEITSERPDIEQIVIVKDKGRELGFVVDEVLGDYQTVIKSLGKIYKNAEGFSGATILGDGSVALIVDIHKLADMAYVKELSSTKK